MTVGSLIEQISSGKLNPLSLYNLDIDYDQYYAAQHYLENKNDTVNILQPLRKSYTDIEIYTKRTNEFPDITQAEFPVSAITFFIDKKYTCFLLKDKKFHSKIDLSEEKILDHLNKMSRKEDEKYLDDDETIEVKVFTDSLEMVKEYWERIKKEDPALLSSYNGDTFDFPYLYYFLLKKLKSEKKVAEVMSPFSTVKLDHGRDRAGKAVTYVRIAGLPICDFFYYFKPRDDGGCLSSR